MSNLKTNTTSLQEILDKVNALPAAGESDLPDWDDDSPIIFTVDCYQNSNIRMYISENGTCTYKRHIRKADGHNFYADHNPKWSYSNFNQIIGNRGANTKHIVNVKQAKIENVENPVEGELITIIDNNTFTCMPNLKHVQIPNTITTINQNAFLGCSSLKRIELPDAVNSIGNRCFYGCCSLEKINIPPLVTTLASYVFCECTKLTEVKGIEQLTSIAGYAFDGCVSLKTPIVLNEAITDLGDRAFRSCHNISSATFLGTPTGTISASAFEYCPGISDIYVPWSEGAVANAPWGATNATIHYNTTYDENHNPIV